MSADGPRALHRVVEKYFNDGRRNFEYRGGLWHESVASARQDAARLMVSSLAHRMFICKGGRQGALGDVVEEIELLPLRVRMQISDRATLSVRDAGRLSRQVAQLA